MNKRRWILWLLVASFLWLVISRFNQIEELATTLASGIWQWVLAAAGFEILFFVLQAKLFQVAFAAAGVQARTADLLPVYVGSMFVNAVAPSGGTAGLALYVDDAVQRGESGARATAGTLLGLVATFVGFGLVLVAGLTYMAVAATIRVYVFIAAVVLLLIALALTALLFLGARRPSLLRSLLDRLQQTLDRISQRLRHRPLLAVDWAETTAQDFTSAAAAVGGNPRQLLPLVAWGVLAHLSSTCTVYVLFLAFRNPVTIGVALAGYGIGHLFVIVSPSPQGVGFVETIMPLTFTALGVPGAVATIVVLTYRGLSFWLPMLAGFLLLRRLRSLGARGRAVREEWSVRVLALLTAFLGIVNVLSAVTPGFLQEFASVARYAPLQVRRAGQLGAWLTGIALLLLANALWRRKRAAWAITLFVLIVSAVSHMVNHAIFDPRALLTLAIAGWLFTSRHHFHARSDPPSVRQGIVVLGLALVTAVIYGAGGIWILARRVGAPLDFRESLAVLRQMVFSLQPPLWLTVPDSALLFTLSVYTLVFVSLIYAMFLLLRPVLVRRPASEEEQQRARAIIERRGRSSMARLALRPDNAYFFTPDGSVVAFHLEGRVAVAFGDPIGPAEDAAAAVAAYCDHCQANDWLPAFYQARAELSAVYEASGLETLAIGEEAVVDLQAGELDSGLNAMWREEIDSLRTRGFRSTVFDPPLTYEQVRDLQLVSDEWLTMMHATGNGVGLSWFDQQYVANCPAAVVYRPSGLISAFATMIVDDENHHLALDLLRYRSQVNPATLRMLLQTVYGWAHARGIKSATMGVSLALGVGDPALERVLDHLRRNGDGVFAATNLPLLDDSIDLQWRPRYLVYPGAGALPRIWLATVHAMLGTRWPWRFLKRQLGL